MAEHTWTRFHAPAVAVASSSFLLLHRLGPSRVFIRGWITESTADRIKQTQVDPPGPWLDMYSQYWMWDRDRRPDYRRYTVVEGACPLPLGSTCRRKRLRSLGEEDDEGVRSCASRPNPEGGGGGGGGGGGSQSADELSRYAEPDEKGEGLQRLCQRCHIMVLQLIRQAAALTDTAALKDTAYASFVFNKLQRLQLPRRGRHALIDARCDVCGSAFQQLRCLALRRALGISGEMAPRPAAAPPPGDAPDGSWTKDELLPAKQQRWSYEDEAREGGAPRGWGSVQSTYLGGGGAKGLATVTPLPLDARHYLEGVWRVSCRGEYRETTALRSGGVTTTGSDPEVLLKPESHSIATQTGRSPSAAAAFFVRAAQKLSLSRRKKPQPDPAPGQTPAEVPGTLVYTGGFSGALQLSPPPVPPCLLRAGSKIKDTPGMGKVRVMVRICSVHGDSSESVSFLKVDSRKKQLTIRETSAGGHAAAAHRRPSGSAPKTFSFDAVFSQDASQAEVCSGTVAEVIQSVVNGADGCIFCFGHAHLGKTYTMIGQDCSTHSLGVAPTAISWLFKVIEERREKAGVRFSVQVSAVEISGREETLTDLLAEVQHEALGPAVSLREDPICGSQLQNQTELKATTAERAAFFLDAALMARRSNRTPDDQEARRNAHFLFTLHLYQERQDKSNKAAVSGRSCLHLLDLGTCETDISRTREGGGGQCLSLSALGNVVLALANGAKHVPYRDSKLTMLLSQSLGNINCRTTMIAHVSDAPANYMETLTTVQLASRIHRTRKKKATYTSSSSGGESSCEEGPSHRPPHLRTFHPRTVALDPVTPLLLSSDPDYSSSSEHSCDTVIYVGPGGIAISDRELSDNEGPPSFVPIIPSLNKKRARVATRSDGDHFKCNTFAELQERLDYIDGSEGPAPVSTEAKSGQGVKTGPNKATEATSPPHPDKTSSQRPTESTNTPGQENKLLSACVIMDKRTSADGEKLSAPPLQPCVVKPPGPPSQNPKTVVREKVYLRGGIPKPTASPSIPRTFRAESQGEKETGRTPPVGMSQQRTPQTNAPQSVTSGRYLDREFLRTTVTLQQPVELNGEDELVFTVVEELPHGLLPDNGRPSNVLSFNRDCSLQTFSPRSHPVSIISSINDEYDAYMVEHRAEGSGSDLSHDGSRASWQSEAAAHSAETETRKLYLTSKTRSTGMTSALTSPCVVHRESFLQKSSLNDSGVGFSELDSDPSTPNKPSLTKCPPFLDSTKVFLKTSRVRASSSDSAQTLHHAAHSSLPRKNKPTSSATVGCSRLEGRGDEVLLQGSSYSDPREVEGLSTDKPSNGTNWISSKRPSGNSNSVPRPPKVHTSSSAQRVVDGCERSSSRRGDTLIKLPRLTRGATTLGTFSPESKWAYEGAAATNTLRFSSLGKKSNGHKSSIIAKSGSGSISLSSQEHKTRTVLSPSALKSSSCVGKSSFPKASTSEEEFTPRQRADSFSHRTSSFKTDHSAKTSSSLKTRGAKADSSRYFGSLMSLERCVSPVSAGPKLGISLENSGACLAGNSRSNRSVPASPSTSQVPPSPCASTSKLMELKGSSTRVTGSGGMKVRTLSVSSAKSLSSSSKPPDMMTGRIANLPPTSRSPARSSAGTKPGRGTIMGTKQAVSRAANSRVSELAAGNQRKMLNRQPVVNTSTDSGTSSISGSLTNPALPSPYSKITAPRRPQRYSSGHGSDNSSILSGELPPAMGRTALFYHSGGSSGYESMIRDSETTGSTSSAHDSMSESGRSTSNRGRVSKSPKKRGNGFLRRRLIPAPLPDPSTLGLGVGGQWVDLPPLGGTLKEPFEIKVYEIDNVERVQRRRDAAGAEPLHDVEKGLLYFNARLRMLEKRQQQIRDLTHNREKLKAELEDAKTRLMLDPGKWNGDFNVDPALDPESQDYLEALAQVTAELQYCVNLCKSRVMMETCFDIAVTTITTQGGQQEVEV